MQTTTTDPSELGRWLAAGPRVQVLTDAGKPASGHAMVLIRRNASKVWSHIEDPKRLSELIRMVETVSYESQGDVPVVRVDLKFKIALFAARFHFVAAVHRQSERVLELKFRKGSVKDIQLRLEVIPVDEGSCVLDCRVGFDMMSLGWLVKTFLRHHPEIEWGVHSGSVLTVVTSIQDAAESAVA